MKRILLSLVALLVLASVCEAGILSDARARRRGEYVPPVRTVQFADVTTNDAIAQTNQTCNTQNGVCGSSGGCGVSGSCGSGGCGGGRRGLFRR